MSHKHKHNSYNSNGYNQYSQAPNQRRNYLYVDMHIHTEYSKNEEVDVEVEDLLDTAQAQAERSNKRVCIAITDHESMLGCVEAMKLIKENPEKYNRIDFIPGIEINVSLKKIGLDEDGHAIYHKCHMLGYGFDVENKNLLSYSHLAYLKTDSTILNKRIRSGRQLLSAKKQLEEKYNKKVPFSKLYDLKNETKHEELFDKFVNLMSKEFGVNETEIINEIQYKFNRVGTTSVDSTKESKQDMLYMMDVIHEAGGIISIAHANSIRYKNPEKMEFKPKEELVKDFLDKVQELSGNGIDALELFHSENTNNNKVFATLYNYVKSYNMFVTCGSDYHGSLHTGKRISRCCSKRFEKASQRFDKNQTNKKQVFNKIVELPFIKYYKGEEYDANKKFSFSLFNTYENKILTIDEIKGVLNKLSKPHSNKKNKNIEVRSVQQIDTQDEEIENNDSQVLKNNKTDEGKGIE